MPDDYSSSGLTIQEALLDNARKQPNKSGLPRAIPWGGRSVQNADAIPCGGKGVVELQLIGYADGVPQAVDMKCDVGFRLADGKIVSLPADMGGPAI